MAGSKQPNALFTEDRRTLAGGIRQGVLLAVIMVFSLGGYLTVLYWRGHDGKERVTHVCWDDWIPFEPAWVWVYMIPYVLGPVVVGIMRPSTFTWYVQRGLIVVAISLAVFALVPTQTQERTKSDLGEGPTAWLYQNMVAIDDPPANAAPSLHVSLTCLLALALLRDFPRWWWLTVLGILLVWLATLFTRQHHLLDVASGAMLACLVVLVWPRMKMTYNSSDSM